ncbi:GumC family protein [Desulfomonile tiedjei]|uniref:Capsular exopolysaccharide biosynthesis protein n=1 Tax=Desulfomonile tiedjei (strain ATCC 49306 / DSM 6799 / DCB-1) TaxID=706587 RepID=I4CEB6_DESTA|nr:polysaccharide biosynthesis tyrosine autokinase [Desulfomonile tiedjei]AFM27907.1 capsular exopolysaccharide biosynthesis protein [Desulfomonile tiedjei DSM 6799]
MIKKPEDFTDDNIHISVPDREMGHGSARVYTVASAYNAKSGATLPYYGAIIRRRKKIILGIFFGTVFLTILLTLATTPVYRAQAIVELEKDGGVSLSNILTSISPTLHNGVENEDIATEIVIIKSKVLAERLTDELQLNTIPEFSRVSFIKRSFQLLAAIPRAFSGDNDYVLESQSEVRDRIIKKVMDSIQVSREGKSRTMVIAIESESPELSKRMLEKYLELYFDENLSKRRRMNAEASRWLVDEIKNAESRALAALDAVVDFTTTHDMVSLEMNYPNANVNHKLAIFANTSDNLLKSKENRILLESLHRLSGQGMLALPHEFKIPELETLSTKLATMEATYAEFSEVYSDDYPKLVLLKNQIAVLKDRIASTQKQIISSTVQSAKQKELMNEQAFEEAKREALRSNSLGVQYAVLKKDADTTQEIYKLLLKKSKEVQLNTQIIGNNVVTVDPPSATITPIRPRKALNLLLGCLIGVFGALVGAFLAESMDNTIKSVDDVENLDIPNLGQIPNVRRARKVNSRNRKPVELLVNELPTSDIAEAIESVKINLLLSHPDNSHGTLLVTSAISGEGKTFISVLLASAFSSDKTPVLLIEGDLRRPRFHKIFSQPDKREYGLSTILARPDINPARAMQLSEIPGLYYIDSGPLPEHPSRLLQSGRLEEVIPVFKEHFHHIIIDAPPLTGLSDAKILTHVADGIILVVKNGYSSPLVVQRAVTSLTGMNGGANLIGTVFNAADTASVFRNGRSLC